MALINSELNPHGAGAVPDLAYPESPNGMQESAGGLGGGLKPSIAPAIGGIKTRCRPGKYHSLIRAGRALGKNPGHISCSAITYTSGGGEGCTVNSDGEKSCWSNPSKKEWQMTCTVSCSGPSPRNAKSYPAIPLQQMDIIEPQTILLPASSGKQ